VGAGVGGGGEWEAFWSTTMQKKSRPVGRPSKKNGIGADQKKEVRPAWKENSSKSAGVV